MNTAIIVDDDKLICRLVASILRTMDCEVMGTGEMGTEVLPLYREHMPDLVLLGINMPKVNGMEALKDLLDEYPNAQVVMLTDLADVAIAEATIAAGAKDFLHKDSGMQDLRGNIERVLRKIIKTPRAPSDSGAVPVEDYTSNLMDILKRRASVRSFTDRHVPDAMVRAVLSAAQHAPTSSNMQAYSFVVVRDDETKLKLAELAGGQGHVAQCPVFVAICADIHRLEDAIATGGGSLAKGHMEMSLVATIDAALKMHRALGIERGVIVQATTYGADHSVVLDALEQNGLSNSTIIALWGDRTCCGSGAHAGSTAGAEAAITGPDLPRRSVWRCSSSSAAAFGVCGA